jgi:DNA-binding beta-propeller fold protein YncE
MRGWSPSLTIGLVLAAAFAGCGDDMAARPPSTRPDPNLDPNKPTTGALCAAGQICTLAGTGIAGDGQDGLPARQTRLYLPQDTTVGPDGRLFVVDWNNHRIRVIEADGTMRIVAGAGELGLAADDPTTDRLNHPTHVAFDATGSPDELWIAAWHNSRVKKVDLTTGTVTDVCGTGKRGFAGNDGPAAAATLDLPVALVFDAGGNMLIADQANQMIRRVDRTTGMISTIAGTGHCADAINPNPCVLNDGGPATAAGFHFPIGQMASPGGRIALAADGAIYVADTDNFRVRRIDTAGVITTFAGTGTWGFAGDGAPAAAAQLGRVADVAVGPDGRVYIADSDNDCVRVVSPDGIIATLAGRCGTPGFEGDDGPATAALLDRPSGVEVGRQGEIYVADTHNQRIRVVYPQSP